MTDYSEMTDNQIDRKVGAALGVDTGLDYCNDWAAIGPIIEDNKISIQHESHVSISWGANWCATGVAKIDGVVITNCAYSDSMTRAAAICFLMMLGKV